MKSPRAVVGMPGGGAGARVDKEASARAPAGWVVVNGSGYWFLSVSLGLLARIG